MSETKTPVERVIPNAPWFFYLAWVFSALASVLIIFPAAWFLDVFVIDEIVGQTIWVRGVERITEDYIFFYVLIPGLGVAIGLIQYLLLRTRFAKMGWWVLITGLGWSLGWLGIAWRYTPLGDFELPASEGFFLAAGLLLGALMGFAQWLLLRSQLPHAAWWIPVSALGFGVAFVLFANLLNNGVALLAFTLPSVCTGVVLWTLLEKLPRPEAAV